MKQHIYFERTDREGAAWVCFLDVYDHNSYLIHEESALVKSSPHIDAELEDPEKHEIVANWVLSRLDESVLDDALFHVEVELTTPQEWEQLDKGYKCSEDWYWIAMIVDTEKPRLWKAK